MKVLVLILTLGLLFNPIFSQTILFSEDFDDETITDMSGTSSQGIAWTATCPACATGDIFEVNTFGAIVQGLRGNDTNGPASFVATGIDATGMHILVLEFDYESSGYSGSGNLECHTECSGCSGDPADVLTGTCNNCWDFLSWDISTGTFTDGGIVLGNDCSVLDADHVVSTPSCSSPYDGNGNLIPGNDPSNLTVTITMAMWASAENMIIDNVVITGYTKSEAIAAGFMSEAGDDNTVDLCVGTGTHNLFSDLLGTPDGGGTWDGPIATTNGDQGTIDLATLTTGTYDYITSTGAGCEDTATITVTSIGTTPSASVNGVADICQGDMVTITGSGTGTFEWSDGSSNPTLDITTAGNYWFAVHGGCDSDTAFFSIGDLGMAPTGVLTGNQFVCDSSATTTLTASGGSSYLWSTNATSTSELFGGGDTGYVLIFNQCGQDSIAFTVADETVVAAFTLSDTTGEEPLAVQTTNNSTNATSYSWNFGDGNTSTDVAPTNEYASNGEYTASLVASNAFCSDSISVTVLVYDPAPLVIPNICTPNTDGLNDLFKVVHYSVSEFNGSIYNRWGQLLFENTDQYIFQWDGYNESGKPAPDGTYYYVLEATFQNGETETFTGSFQLVR
jgi:gliding motility-associated-like protein